MSSTQVIQDFKALPEQEQKEATAAIARARTPHLVDDLGPGSPILARFRPPRLIELSAS